MSSTSSTDPAPSGTSRPVRAAPADDLPLIAASAAGLVVVYLISHLGFVWDTLWHQDVGPDTFFTAPHLMIYSGAAGAGLLALGVVLLSTWRTRTTGRLDLSTTPLLGARFHGPLGIAVVGWGGVVFLVAGLYDQAWHAVYGFDVVLDSPPHVALSLADIMVAIGIMVLSSMLITRTEDGARARWIRPFSITALALVAALFATASVNYQAAMAGVTVAGLDPSLLLVAATYTFLLLLVAGVVRRPGVATLMGLCFTAVYLVDWMFATWATYAYADALGLFPRDDAAGYPMVIAVLPKFVLPAGLAVDAVLLAARRRGTSVRTGVLAGAAVGATVLIGLELLVPGLPVISATAARGPLISLVTVLVAAALGALGGWAGWATAVRMRRLPGTAHALTAATITGGGR